MKKLLIGCCLAWCVTGLCAPAANGGPSINRSINENTIRNYTYFLDFSKQRVSLKDGYARQGSHPDDYLEVRLKHHLIRDLNSDGLKDAVVILASSPMGSGSFFELTALIASKNGGAVYQSNSIHLGDRIVIRSLSFKSKAVVLDMNVHRDQDPSCCPSKRIIRCFHFVNGKLVESHP